MRRNPNAPKSALTLKDIRPGLDVVVIGGGSYYHDHMQIVSKPFTKQVPKSNRMGVLKGDVVSYYVKVRQQGYAFDTDYSLASMGVCPDVEGHWLSRYVVTLTEYRRNYRLYS